MSASGLLTAERERNLRRDHERMHPDGLTQSGRVCDVCMLLAALADADRVMPRCSITTARGFRCSKARGHLGRHSHPREAAASSEGAEA